MKRRPVKVSPARDLEKRDVEYVRRDLGKRPRDLEVSFDT